MTDHVAGTINPPELLTDADMDLGAVGTISTARHPVVRYHIGHETGDVFGRDCDYDGPTLTLEVADMADAVAMLRAILPHRGMDEPVADTDLDEAWKSGFNAGFGEAMLTKDAPAVRLPDDVAGLCGALRSGEQADMDGCRVKVSRQACEEAADTIEAQAAELARLREALTKINVGDGWAAQIARAALAQKGSE